LCRREAVGHVHPNDQGDRRICRQGIQVWGDAKLAIESLTEATWTEPSDPPTTATLTLTQKRIWEKEVDEFVKRRQYFELNMTSIYSLLWGQCSEAMRTKLMSISTHGAIAHASNAIELLKNIRDTVYNFQGQQYKDQALQAATKRFYLFTQDKHATCQVYLQRFTNIIEVIEHCGGTIGEDTGLVDSVLHKNNLARAGATQEQI
jgi:hypothetical protein